MAHAKKMCFGSEGIRKCSGFRIPFIKIVERGTVMLENAAYEENRTYTENGAVTYRSSQSYCLDLFGTIGALRGETEVKIEQRFIRAFAEDADLAMKIAFYARDVRGGLGERRVFRIILKWLAQNSPSSVIKNMETIAEFGRYDDLLVLIETSCGDAVMELIRTQLEADLSAAREHREISLLAKWLPSVNASNQDAVRLAKRIAAYLKMTEREYRKALSFLRGHIRIIENNLRERNYTFDYGKQSSKAIYKYRNAFLRNDKRRYRDFLSDVRKGEKILHTGTLTPYEIVAPYIHMQSQWNRTISKEEREAADVTWNAQEDFTNGENALVVVDGSGSMYWQYNQNRSPLPAAVAQSLAIYFAERNRGAFHNHFMTFSTNPQLVEIRGRDIVDKLQYCMSFNECANTDIKKVFRLILLTAIRYNIPQEELPSTIYIISDMEFDWCTQNSDMTNFEYAKERFAAHGYQLPQVVFWNVASHNVQQPVTRNEQGAVLVSGCTPRIFASVMAGEKTPYEYMMEVLGSERYAGIAA